MAILKLAAGLLLLHLCDAGMRALYKDKQQPLSEPSIFADILSECLDTARNCWHVMKPGCDQLANYPTGTHYVTYDGRACNAPVNNTIQLLSTGRK